MVCLVSRSHAGGAEIAGVDDDGGKAQEVNNDGVDFTELS